MVFKAIMNGLIKAKAMPQISPTERQALEAGTVWIDGQVFSGKPDFAKMFAEPYSKLNQRERDFIDGPVQQLCEMCDPHEIATTRIIPKKSSRLFGICRFLFFPDSPKVWWSGIFGQRHFHHHGDDHIAQPTAVNTGCDSQQLGGS